MLEIGSGDGYLATLLAPLGRRLVTSDSSPAYTCAASRLARLRCTATALPFADASFDFIFSSSVLEHVRDRPAAMAEMRRCLRPDGTMVHIMPSPTWKLLQLAFYYPHLVLGGLEWLRQDYAPAGESTERWTDQRRTITWREILRGVFPTVHGEFDGHLAELKGFAAGAWVSAFRCAGFAVRRLIRLPLYSGYGFGLDGLRRAGESYGLSAHNAFVVTSPRGDTADRWWS